MQKDHQELIQSIFGNLLEPELIQTLVQEGKIQEHRHDETVVQIGQDIVYMPIVLTGSLKVLRENENAQEILMYYISTGETCAATFTCCMMQNKSEVLTIAEEDVVLLMIPVRFMDEWLVKYSSWKSYIMKNIKNRFHDLFKTIDGLAFHKLDERLLNYLHDKARTHHSKLLNLSHQQIADELATSRVVISRLLKQLENEKKLLLYRNQIKLLGEM